MSNSPFTAQELADEEKISAQEEFARYCKDCRGTDAANDEMFGDFSRFTTFDDTEGF